MCVPDKAAQMYFGSMNFASVQPDESLRCAWRSCVFVCILHNHMRVLQSALSHSLINVFTVRMAN